MQFKPTFFLFPFLTFFLQFLFFNFIIFLSFFTFTSNLLLALFALVLIDLIIRKFLFYFYPPLILITKSSFIIKKPFLKRSLIKLSQVSKIDVYVPSSENNYTRLEIIIYPKEGENLSYKRIKQEILGWTIDDIRPVLLFIRKNFPSIDEINLLFFNFLESKIEKKSIIN